MSDVITGQVVWEEHERLKRHISNLEDELLKRTDVFARNTRAYRSKRADVYESLVDAKSANARSIETDNHPDVARLKGETDASEAELQAIRELIWNAREQLRQLNPIADVVQAEIRMGGKPA